MSKLKAMNIFTNNIKPMVIKAHDGVAKDGPIRAAYANFLLGMVEGGVITERQYFDWLG